MFRPRLSALEPKSALCYRFDSRRRPSHGRYRPIWLENYLAPPLYLVTLWAAM